MSPFIRISSFVLYALASVAGFLLGIAYTLVSGAAENQGLGAGAIIIFNAAVGVVVGLLLSLFFVSKSAKVTRINWILLAIDLAIAAILILTFKNN